MANLVIFHDSDGNELARISGNHDGTQIVPREGEAVSIKGTAMVVDRVGYDIPAGYIKTSYIRCVPAA